MQLASKSEAAHANYASPTPGYNLFSVEQQSGATQVMLVEFLFGSNFPGKMAAPRGYYEEVVGVQLKS